MPSDINQPFFVAAPRTSLAGLQSTVTAALPCISYQTEVLDSLLSA